PHLTGAIAGPAVAVRGQPLAFTLTAAEDGLPAGAVFTWKIDWNGDGTVDQTVTGPSGSTVGHIYPGAHSYTAKLTGSDGVGSVAVPALTVPVGAVALETDPADPTKTALYVGGTGGNDTVTILPANATGTSVTVTINGVAQKINGTTTLSPTGHIIVYGQ